MDDFSVFAPPELRRNSSGYLWTQEDDKVLTEMWPSHTAGAISRVLFPRRTRSAVMGRVHRLKLISKTKPIGTKIRKPSKPYKPRIKPIGWPTINPQPKIEVPPEPQGWQPIGVSLLEATRHHCRAIIEPAPTAEAGIATCCGLPFRIGQALSFCDYHMELYTEPPGRRRRRNWRHWRNTNR